MAKKTIIETLGQDVNGTSTQGPSGTPGRNTGITPTTNNQGTTGGGTGEDTGSGTGSGGGGSTLDKLSEGNMYYDVIASQQVNPGYQAPEDTSAGSQAANGTMYSWNKQGLDAAQNQYNQEVLKAKQDALANRQVQEQNALQYQQQADMMKYANNQDAEKVGWTGGYVLDQNRQMEYLKASIQAQMYGAMELQKYGYDSALAAARLSYDLNQKEFAHKYYQDAVNVAITEAQITGTYFSAETRDMMSQLNAADQELGLYDESGKALSLDKINEGIKDGSIILTPEQERALVVKSNIEKWYAANEVSPTGIQTLAAWEAEQSMAQAWADKQWQMYQAAIDAANNKDAEDVNTFVMYDEKGNPIYNGNNVELGNFRNMTAEEIINYYNSTSSTGKEQVYGYIDNLFEETVLSYVNSATTIKNSDGSETIKINKNTLATSLIGNSKVRDLTEVLDGYNYTTQAGKSAVSIAIDSEGKIQVTIKDSESTTPIQQDGNLAPSLEDVNGTIVTSWDANASGYNFVYSGKGDNYKIVYNNTDYNVTIVWSNYTTIETANGFKAKEIRNINNELKETYPNSSNGRIVYYNNAYWTYNGDTKAWGLIVTGDDQDKKANDAEKLIKALNGK